jgi:4-amino-4-deoxy-L-arabinose transferase-like glycosyltransferase
MEGGSVDHVRRILSGQKLYVRPSLEFIPYIYTPFYFYLSAIVSKIIGIGFMPLRLVSFISSLGCFLIIFLIVYQETRDKFSGFLASCLFFATFRISGAWFDIARVDSLFLFFLLITIYLIKFKISVKSYILAGVFISLAFLTKQSTLIVSLPMMLSCIFLNRRYSGFFIGVTVITIVLSTLLLNYIHNGWYNYYIFYLPRRHLIRKYMWGSFWTKDIMSHLPIACIISIFYLFIQFLWSNKKNCIFYFLMLIGMVGSSWLVRIRTGSYDNVLFPAYAIISILFGLGVHSAFKITQVMSLDKRRVMEIYIYLICIIQFACLLYSPSRQIPTQKDLEAGKKLINMMTQIEGEIFIPCHGYLPVLAGKKSYAQWVAVEDVLGGGSESSFKLNNEIREAISKKKFSVIILDHLNWFSKEVEKNYIRQGTIFNNDKAFWSITGMRTRPNFLYVLKK